MLIDFFSKQQSPIRPIRRGHGLAHQGHCAGPPALPGRPQVNRPPPLRARRLLAGRVHTQEALVPEQVLPAGGQRVAGRDGAAAPQGDHDHAGPAAAAGPWRESPEDFAAVAPGRDENKGNRKVGGVVSALGMLTLSFILYFV